jgi:hypothetical protein
VDTQNQGLLVLAIFVVTQVLDGSLTYWGVNRFGLGVEMNGWLATTMQAFGAGAALIAAKGLACFCGCVLYLTSYLRPLTVATGLCIGVAVGPWLFVFVMHAI